MFAAFPHLGKAVSTPRAASVLVALCLALPFRASAQIGAPPVSIVLAGRVLSCPVGSIFVPIIVTPNIPNNDIAFSALVNGTPVILLSPNVPSLAGPVQLFLFGHECEHHRLGHVIGNISASMEVDADCNAIQQLVRLQWIGPFNAQTIAAQFYPNAARPPVYPPGPVRAQHIMDCYQSAVSGG